ncbi:MAG: hypothetical protein L3J45_07275 [Flavobacteriaceae bacterium]|nr:hypothetical protein [Flavobacteriaceae bacterium]
MKKIFKSKITRSIAIGLTIGFGMGVALKSFAIGAGIGVAFGAAFDLLIKKDKRHKNL